MGLRALDRQAVKVGDFAVNSLIDWATYPQLSHGILVTSSTSDASSLSFPVTAKLAQAAFPLPCGQALYPSTREGFKHIDERALIGDERLLSSAPQRRTRARTAWATKPPRSTVALAAGESNSVPWLNLIEFEHHISTSAKIFNVVA
jgi:hypothetical protein